MIMMKVGVVLAILVVHTYAAADTNVQKQCVGLF